MEKRKCAFKKNIHCIYIFLWPVEMLSINRWKLARALTHSEYTGCIWPSFIYHYRLKISDYLRFTKVSLHIRKSVGSIGINSSFSLSAFLLSIVLYDPLNLMASEYPLAFLISFSAVTYIFIYAIKCKYKKNN